MPGQASSPDLPALHAWTHRPKSQGGTDPIELPGGPEWCLAGIEEESIDPTTDPAVGSGTIELYRIPFTYIAKSTGSSFELSTPDVNLLSEWLIVNDAGYYHMWSGCQIEPADDWDSSGDLFLDPIFERDSAGPAPRPFFQFTNPRTDFMMADFGSTGQRFAAEDKHRGLWKFHSFKYDPGSGLPDSFFDDESPLKIGLRVYVPGATVDLALTAQIHLVRIADPDYELIDNLDA